MKLLKLKFLFFVIYGIISTVKAQNIDGVCNNVFVFGNFVKNNEVTYIKYTPFLQLKERYTSFKQVKNSTPEELLVSQMSVQNNDWLFYNFNIDLKWREEQFFRIKTQDINKNYLEITRKVSYTYEDTKYSIMRVNIYDDRKDKPIVISIKTQYKDGRWVLIQDKEKSSIDFLLMNLNLKNLDAIFENRASGNLVFDKIIKSSWNNNYLKMSNIYLELGNLMLNNDKSAKNIFQKDKIEITKTINYQKYTTNYSSSNNKIKTDFIIPLKSQNYCYYFLNELSKFKDSNTKTIIEYLELKNISADGKKSKIIPVHKFQYLDKNKNLVFIKYLAKGKGSESKQYTDVLELSSSGLKVVNSLNFNNALIKKIITISKKEIIIEFSNSINNPRYPEINRLKSLVKDHNGILDIKKLVKVLDENTASLSKYLE